MQIGELAERTGVSRDTLRYYEKRGLIRAYRRPNGYRHYPEAALFVLDYVQMAQRLGFTLSEIEAEIPGLSAEGITGERIDQILRSKIEVIDRRIADLTSLRDALEARVEATCPIMAPQQ
jgi:MerR family copper efflux transcriptional regulator